MFGDQTHLARRTATETGPLDRLQYTLRRTRLRLPLQQKRVHPLESGLLQRAV